MDTIVVFDPAPGPASGITYTILSIQTSTTGTATPSFTVDLSGYGSGDVLVVWYGATQTVTSVNYNTSNAMTAVSGATSTAGNVGSRVSVHQYTLAGAGGASDTIDYTIAAVNSNHIFGAVIVSGASVSSTNAQYESGAATNDIASSLTVSNASNLAIGVGMFESGTGGVSWLTGITNEVAESQVGTNSYLSIASLENASTGTLNVTADSVGQVYDASYDRSLSLVLFE